MLSAHKPLSLPRDFRTHAAVALILRTSAAGQEVLFIERALYDGDPWSGNIGFPGGKVEAYDLHERLAAERETLEEIGLDLKNTRFLGRLADVTGSQLPVRVSCFVYGLTQPASIEPGAEVQTAFWVSLRQLCDPARHINTSVPFHGTTLVRLAIRVLDPGRAVLWGLTYRLVLQFLQLLGLSGSAHLCDD